MTPIRLEESPPRQRHFADVTLHFKTTPESGSLRALNLAPSAIAYGRHFWVIYCRHHPGRSPALTSRRIEFKFHTLNPRVILIAMPVAAFPPHAGHPLIVQPAFLERLARTSNRNPEQDLQQHFVIAPATN